MLTTINSVYKIFASCLFSFALNGPNFAPCVARKEKIMACYFMGGKIGDLSGSDVDPFLCTHILCAHGVVTPDGIGTRKHIDAEQFRAVASLKKKNPNLKVMVSLRGGFESVVDQPSVDVIMRFSLKAVTFLEMFNMDGIDLDWEHPNASEKQRYVLFIKILGTYLHSSNLLLSLALPAHPYKVDFYDGYDFPTLNEYMDFITVMCYGYNWYNEHDYHLTAYNSPLYTPKGELMYQSTADSLTYLLYKGLSKEKLLMGIPTYGYSYTLENAHVHGLHSPAIGGGRPAPYSSHSSIYIYADVCVTHREGGVIVEDEVNIGQYVYNGTQWASFDGKFTHTKKIHWLMLRDLAGVGIWSYQFDDFNNVCGEGPMPLLTWLHTLLHDAKPTDFIF